MSHVVSIETRVRDILATDAVQVGIFDAATMSTIQQEDLSLYTEFIVFLTKKICRKFRLLC